jgi:hypothetical protein
MSEDTRSAAIRVDLFGEAAAPGITQDCLARFGEFLVATDMFGVAAGINNVANPPARQPLDLGQDFIRRLPGASVHKNDARRPDLDCDVAARPGNHVKVRPDLHDIQTIAGHLRRPRDTANSNTGEDHHRRCPPSKNSRHDLPFGTMSFERSPVYYSSG